MKPTKRTFTKMEPVARENLILQKAIELATEKGLKDLKRDELSAFSKVLKDCYIIISGILKT